MQQDMLEKLKQYKPGDRVVIIPARHFGVAAVLRHWLREKRMYTKDEVSRLVALVLNGDISEECDAFYWHCGAEYTTGNTIILETKDTKQSFIIQIKDVAK
jgi:hypothetical protein